MKKTIITICFLACAITSFGYANSPCECNATPNINILSQMQTLINQASNSMTCVDAELIEKQIKELADKLHNGAWTCTPEVVREIVLVDVPTVATPTVSIKELATTGVKEATKAKKKPLIFKK